MTAVNNKQSKEQMTIVIVGHVDHGKSTVIGRLYADTGSLPEGKLEQVEAMCVRNSRPFEYAFLLDALKDEQAQGITIDSARSFFKTDKRNYMIFDAPGHIEFLKNMVTGAAHAEAALLVIDAQEGIQENSKRHGYLLSMLGVKQISVLVNKMDLVEYKQDVFDAVVRDYTAFLKGLNVFPASFIPISAREGDLIIAASPQVSWYQGPSVLDQLDAFTKEKKDEDKPARFPVQDVYKFTEQGDDRRIVVGTIASGQFSVGDDVVFLPSHKESVIKSVEEFNVENQSTAYAGQAVGFTLSTQIYIKPGEVMVKKAGKLSQVSARFKANIFWMGRAPFIKEKTYKLKIATTRINVKLVEICRVIDASELGATVQKSQVNRHDVAEVVLETTKPIAFDLSTEIETTGRFVIVDHYEIVAGGIIAENIQTEKTLLDQHIKERESIWDRGFVSTDERFANNKHKSKFIVLCGEEHVGKRDIAKALERSLFDRGQQAFYLGLSNILHGLDSDFVATSENKEEHIRRLGELARIMTEAGFIFITTIHDLDDYDIKKLVLLNSPNEIIVVAVGANHFSEFQPDFVLPANGDKDQAIHKIYELLKSKDILPLDYQI